MSIESEEERMWREHEAEADYREMNSCRESYDIGYRTGLKDGLKIATKIIVTSDNRDCVCQNASIGSFIDDIIEFGRCKYCGKDYDNE